MEIYDFNIKYATEWVDQHGNKVLFQPCTFNNRGAMYTTSPGMPELGGEYSLRNEGGNLYLRFYPTDVEFLILPTIDGFQLLMGSSPAYSFTRLKKNFLL